MSTKAPVGIRDHLLGLALGAAYVAVLLATAGDLGMSRDESFYVVAAERYAGWLEGLAHDPARALDRQAIDRAWEFNHEHPALMKTLFALSWLAHRDLGFLPSDSLAFRFPGMVSAGLLLWLVYIFGARAFGRAQGAFGALALALLPRVFYHAHLDCFDVPIVLMTTWTTYAYWRSLTRPRWAWMTGIAFGCALATKHNSWILPGIFAIHFAWVSWGQRQSGRASPALDGRVPRVPWWLLAMAALGPPLFVGSWPWLWHDTWPRFVWYARFHMDHAYYNMAYFGENYFRPPFPVSFPWVMTAFTWPVTSLALAVVGFMRHAPALWPPGLPRPRFLPPATRDVRETVVLMTGCMLAPLLLISLPSTPIFGATKHWFPAYPFMALFAGEGFVRVCDALRAKLPQLWARARGGLPVAAGALLLAPAVVETAHSHPFGLSHYGYLAGGVPGAADRGMNRQFWGFTTGSLVPYLRERLPHGGRVWLNDTTYIAFRMLQRDGLLPPSIRPARDLAQADLALVHHEHHFAEVDYQLWRAYGSVRPDHVLTYDGVPIVSVYANPRRLGR